MEDTRPSASASAPPPTAHDATLNIQDAALNIRLESVFNTMMGLLSVASPSHSDIGDTHRMSMAAADSNSKHLNGGKKAAAADAALPLPVGNINEAEAQKVSDDLETLKTHEHEVSAIFNKLMQYVEGEGAEQYPPDEDMTEREKEGSEYDCADVGSLTATCANNRILHPLQKLQLFSWLIKSKGVQVDNLTQLLNGKKKSNALWMMLPALINVSMDIIAKLCCTWAVYASQIDLEALASKEANSNCLLASSDPCVRHTVNYVNNLIKARRDTMVHAPSAASAYAANETHRSIKNRRGIMATQLADIISPLLNNIDEVLRNHLME